MKSQTLPIYVQTQYGYDKSGEPSRPLDLIDQTYVGLDYENCGIIVIPMSEKAPYNYPKCVLTANLEDYQNINKFLSSTDTQRLSLTFDRETFKAIHEMYEGLNVYGLQLSGIMSLLFDNKLYVNLIGEKAKEATKPTKNRDGSFYRVSQVLVEWLIKFNDKLDEIANDNGVDTLDVLAYVMFNASQGACGYSAWNNSPLQRLKKLFEIAEDFDQDQLMWTGSTNDCLKTNWLNIDLLIESAIDDLYCDSMEVPEDLKYHLNYTSILKSLQQDYEFFVLNHTLYVFNLNY